jgi:hypothetical protein
MGYRLHQTLLRAAPEPRRILTLDNIVIYGVPTVRLRSGSGAVPGHMGCPTWEMGNGVSNTGV